MNAKITRISAGIFFAAVAAAANADYRCDAPQTINDRQACEAAQKGPDALRRFVNRWDQQMANLLFADYVNSATEQRWEKMARTQKETTDAPKLASNERR